MSFCRVLFRAPPDPVGLACCGLAFAFAFSGTFAIPINAQSTTKENFDRFQVGAAYEFFGYSPCNTCSAPPQNQAGVTATVFPLRNLAVDATFLSGLEDDTSQDANQHAGGRSSQLLIGPRLTTRSRHVDFFIESQLGYLHWSNVYQGVGNVTSSGATTFTGPETALEMQAGFGAEFALPHRLSFRIHETGNWDHLGPQPLYVYPFPATHSASSHDWHDTARMDLLVGLWPSHEYDLRAPRSDSHRFLDRTNLLLIAASVGGEAADGYTTQVFLKQGSHEADALARPFVNHGWAASIAAGAIVEAGQLAIMYGLHRKGHHRLERIAPMLVAADGGGNAYRNATIE